MRDPQKFKGVSIFKRGSGWTIQYRIPGATSRTYESVARLGTAEQRAAQISAMIDQAKAGLIAPEMIRHSLAARSAIAKHVEDFTASLVAQGVKTKTAELLSSRLTTIFDACDCQGLADMLPERILRGLQQLRAHGPAQKPKQRKLGPISAQTALHYIRAAKQFSTWCEHNHRTGTDQLSSMTGRGLDVANRRVYVRRVPTDAELETLIITTMTAPEVATRRCPHLVKMSGLDRALAYWVTCETGFRANEIASLTPSDIDLAANPPTVTLRGEFTKNKQPAVQFITAQLAEELRAWLAGKPTDQPAWPLPEKTAEMLRADSDRAGIAYQTDEGLFDFRSLRHVCGSRMVAAGVNPSVVQKVMRHSDIRLTMNRYVHPRAHDVEGAVSAPPPLVSPKQSQEMKATGTDGDGGGGGAAKAQQIGGAKGRKGAQSGTTAENVTPAENESKALENKGLGKATDGTRTHNLRFTKPLVTPTEDADAGEVTADISEERSKNASTFSGPSDSSVGRRASERNRCSESGLRADEDPSCSANRSAIPDQERMSAALEKISAAMREMRREGGRP